MRSCVPQPIADLRLVEVSGLPALALPPSDEFREHLATRGGAVWKVSLKVDSNWMLEVKRHELNSYALVERCDEPDLSVLSLGPYVGLIAATMNSEQFRHYQPPPGTVRYDIFLPETDRYRSKRDFNASMPSYDLGAERMELCIRIAGGAMSGAYNQSNEVRVKLGATP